MKIRRAILAAATLAVAACSSMTSSKVDYAAYAGKPVSEIRFTNLYNWQRTGNKTIAVWTKPSAAYLLTLRHNCDALDSQMQLQIGGVDGFNGRLQAGMGDVVVGQLRCPVVTIQPIDLEAIKRDRRLSRN